MTNNAIAGTWDEWEKEHFPPEEIAESDLRVALIGELIRARQERGITQKQLEEMSGVTQPVIARLERCLPPCAFALFLLCYAARYRPA